MKTTLLRIVLILGLATLVFALFGTKKLKAGDPSGQGAGLIIRSDLPDDKWKKIRKILSAKPLTELADPRGELYRIRVYDGHGKFKEMGTLPKKMLVMDFSEGVGTGFKGHAIQIGVGVAENVDCYPPHGACLDIKVGGESVHSKSKRGESKKLEQDGSSVVPQSEASPSPSATPLFSLHFRANIEESKNMIREVNKVLNSPDAASSPKP